VCVELMFAVVRIRDGADVAYVRVWEGSSSIGMIE
jgi:hypothetical protein